MKKYFPFLLFLMAFQFGIAQTYTVGVQSLTWTDASRSNRSVPVEFHYPGTNSAIANDSFGFVVFGHGFDMTIDAYYNYADSLATHGYIVALTSNEGGLSPSHPNLAQDLIYIYNMMKSESVNNASSPLYHHVKSRGAIAGHSMGGGCTVLSCQYSDTATCYWTLAEATTNPSSVTAAPFMRKPYLSFAGGNDCIAPASTNQIPTYDSSGSVCKTLIEIKNATHCQFAISNVACNFGEGVSGCASTPLSRAAQTDSVLSFLYPYLDYYLNGKCSAWTQFENLYAADVNDVLMQSCNNVIPTNPAITGASSFCSGSSDLLTANPTGFNYQWSNNGTGATINVSNPGTYTLTVSNGTCSLTAAPFAVTQNLPPATPSTITSADTVCSGIANISISVLNDPAATSYNWTLPGGWSITGGNNTHAIFATSGTSSGTISVTAHNNCGTSNPVQKSVIVTLSGLAAPGSVSGDTVPCVGQPVQYVIAAVNGANSYSWNYPTGWTLISGNNSDTLRLTAGSGAGQVSVQAVNGCGQGIPSTLHVTGLTAPVISTIIGDTVVCSGQPTQYSVIALGNPNSFLWSYPTNWNLIAGGTSDSISLTAGSNSGNISVQAINACGRSTAFNISVGIRTAPNAGSITGTDSICVNSNVALAFSLSNATGADSIYWALPDSWNIASGQGTAAITANNNGLTGTVHATVYNTCGSANATPLSITIIDTPQAVISQSHDTLSTVTGSAYQWYLNGQVISGATNQIYLTQQSGSYTVQVTSSTNCTGTSAPFNYIYLSTNDIFNSYPVNIFPNPSSNGIFRINISHDFVGSEITMFDDLGRQMHKGQLNAESSLLDLRRLSKGLYIASIDHNGTILKKRLVIE